MKTSQKGIELIKIFEGVRLNAYMITGEKFYTIGYGHSGADVKLGQTITLKQAEDFLKKDLVKFEEYVDSAVINKKLTFQPNQNQFDALVSFTYNCGPGNLHKMTEGRSSQIVADKMLLYCNGANPNVKAGLLERRKKERSLFLGIVSEPKQQDTPKAGACRQMVMNVNAAKGLNLRDKPGVDGKCIMSLTNGTNVMVLEKCNQKWYQVSVTGNKGQQVTGYCCAEYLK